MLGVGRRCGRGASIAAGGNRRFEARDDLGNVVAVELGDGCVELSALLALDQQLCNFLASLQVFRPHLPNLPLLRRPLPLRV